MYTCTSCGEKHEDMPAIGFTAPYPYNQLSEEERIAYQAECDSDFCIIRYPDQTDRFIRAVLRFRLSGIRKRWNMGYGYLSVKRVLTTIKAAFTIIVMDEGNMAALRISLLIHKLMLLVA